MEEIRFHGRGGQGVVLAATILGTAAAIYEGKHATSFPSFGAERRGAPVTAFTRIADAPLRRRSQIYQPTIVVVLDDSLFASVPVANGLVGGGWLVVNSHRRISELGLPASARLCLVDATAIAREVLGVPITNTTMLGALAAATGVVGLAALERAISDVLPTALVARNQAAARAAYERVVARV
ncbi:MAG: 2-oxoacid:acceptor oxidoreductase family protein [Bacteroidetes bacterium]|nr:2-oxoacid:acceptor oxidoreductase family protein [Bacteroidota bacterium]MCL5027352.1 2-oxoacid:acceptor oxidoreductase family protein [Chloroflexota bacterium]